MDALGYLLEHGTIRVVQEKYIRVVVYTAEIRALDALRRQFGGVCYRHNEYMQRWEINRTSDLLHLGWAIRDAHPRIADYLLRYWGAGKGVRAWQVALQLQQHMGGLSRSFSSPPSKNIKSPI